MTRRRRPQYPPPPGRRVQTSKQISSDSAEVCSLRSNTRPPASALLTDFGSSLFQVFDIKCAQNAVLLPRWALGTSRGDLRDALGSLRGSCDVICMPQDRFRLRFRSLLTSFSMLPSTRELDSRKSYRDDFWSRKSSAKRVPGRPRRRPRGPRELPEPPWSVPGTPPEHPRRSPGAPNACNRAPVTSKRRPGTSKSSLRRPPGPHFGASGSDFPSFWVFFWDIPERKFPKQPPNASFQGAAVNRRRRCQYPPPPGRRVKRGAAFVRFCQMYALCAARPAPPVPRHRQIGPHIKEE